MELLKHFIAVCLILNYSYKTTTIKKHELLGHQRDKLTEGFDLTLGHAVESADLRYIPCQLSSMTTLLFLNFIVTNFTQTITSVAAIATRVHVPHTDQHARNTKGNITGKTMTQNFTLSFKQLL